MTRHHDGHLRERVVVRAITEQADWVVPFVAKLVGEYVIEIVKAIDANLPTLTDPESPISVKYREFAAANTGSLAVTRSRAISYWNCYYRYSYLYFRDSPAKLLLDKMDPRKGEKPRCIGVRPSH